MMKNLFFQKMKCLFLIFFCANFIFGQKKFSKKELDSLVVKFRYINVKEEDSKNAISEINTFLPRIDNDSLKIYFIRQKAFFYSRLRDEPNVLKSHLQTKDMVERSDNLITKLTYYTSLAEVYSYLKMFDLSLQNISESEKLISNINDKKKAEGMIIAVDIIKQKTLFQSKKYKSAISVGFTNIKKYSAVENKYKKNILLMLSNQFIGKSYLELKDFSNAKKHILISRQLEEPYDGAFKFANNNAYAKLLFQTGNVDSAEIILKQFKLPDSKLYPDEEADKASLLAQIYASKNDAANTTHYLQKSDSLVKINHESDMRAIESSIRHTEIEQKKEVYNRSIIIYSLLPLLLAGAFGIFYYKRKKENERKKYVELIEKLNYKIEMVKEISVEQSVSSDVKPTSSSSLNLEREQVILNQLIKFEFNKKFRDPMISLPILATRLKTNTTYLSEVINKHKGKNFNTYINELRIEYIVDKLYNNSEYLNYKISFLAEDAGFISHSSFTTIFKNTLGISPSIFIQNLREEKKI